MEVCMISYKVFLENAKVELKGIEEVSSDREYHFEYGNKRYVLLRNDECVLFDDNNNEIISKKSNGEEIEEYDFDVLLAKFHDKPLYHHFVKTHKAGKDDF